MNHSNACIYNIMVDALKQGALSDSQFQMYVQQDIYGNHGNNNTNQNICDQYNDGAGTWGAACTYCSTSF